MNNCFKIYSMFDKSIIYIYMNSNNKNLRFQYELSIREETDDEFDIGQYWISFENPEDTDNNNHGISLFNSYSSGFMNSTGRKIFDGTYIGLTSGSITFLPDINLDKIYFIKTIKNNNSYNIHILQNDIATDYILTYNIDIGKVYFLEIKDINSIPKYLNCDWGIEHLNRNAPIK